MLWPIQQVVYLENLMILTFGAQFDNVSGLKNVLINFALSKVWIAQLCNEFTMENNSSIWHSHYITVLERYCCMVSGPDQKDKKCLSHHVLLVWIQFAVRVSFKDKKHNSKMKCDLYGGFTTCWWDDLIWIWNNWRNSTSNASLFFIQISTKLLQIVVVSWAMQQFFVGH